MKFLYSFKSGADHDVRQKRFAEYTCSICGHIEDFDITTNPNFDFSRDRKCPKCGAVSEEDRISNLQSEVERLTTTKRSIDVQIEKLFREIEELQNKTA